jgi:phospholipid/cholesterol/gamma-HCH transport system ATP-binding protein
MDEPGATAVLEFRDVEWRPDPESGRPAGATSFVLPPGACMVVNMPAAESFPLADLAEGLAAPSRGQVRFLGKAWDDVSAYESCSLRGRIGRAFEQTCLVSNLDVDENVTLQQRHHTRRAEAELRQEAEMLARELGLPGLPRGRPHAVPVGQQRVCEFVRAFLGDPALVLLECPEADAPPSALVGLEALVARVVGRGTSVVWMARDGRPPLEAGPANVRRYRWCDGRLVEGGGGS